jgi:hypothetical protein
VADLLDLLDQRAVAPSRRRAVAPSRRNGR